MTITRYEIIYHNVAQKYTYYLLHRHNIRACTMYSTVHVSQEAIKYDATTRKALPEILNSLINQEQSFEVESQRLVSHPLA